MARVKAGTKKSDNEEPSQSRITAEMYRTMIVKYYADPESKILSRGEIATKVMKVSRKTMYNHLSPEDISSAEREGMLIRRQRMSSYTMEVDQALLKRAKKGDPKAIKLYYEVIEDWNPARKLSILPEAEAIRQHAIDQGYDPDEYMATLAALKEEGLVPK